MKRPDERVVLLVFSGIGALALVLGTIVTLSEGEDGDSNDPTATVELRGVPESEIAAEPPTRTPVPTIVVRDGEPQGGVSELIARAGQTVRFRVRADVDDEVHVHGYDISKPVRADTSATFAFPANLEGIFEIELEQSAIQLAELRVEP